MKSFCNTIQHATKYQKTYEEQKKWDDNQEKKKNSKNRPRKEPNIGVSVQGIQNNYK